MKPSFDIRVRSLSVLQELPAAWTDQHFSRLLERLEYGDTAGMTSEELREMCLLSLQELEPEEAAVHVLEESVGERLRKGQIQELSIGR